MRKIILPFALIGWITIVTLMARAQEIPVTEESIRELMSVNGMEKPLDTIRQNMQLATEASVRRAFRDQTLSEKQEKILAEVRARVAAMFKEEMIQEKLDKLYIDIYRKSLTQQEVDGLIAFYKTDAGKALIAKMPAVTQQTIEITLRNIEPLVPKLSVIQDEVIRRMKEEK